LGKRFEGDWPTQQNEGWKMSGRKCSTGKREKIPSQRHFFLYSILVALFLLFMISLLTIKKTAKLRFCPARKMERRETSCLG
jgi:hypothetical protein